MDGVVVGLSCVGLRWQFCKCTEIDGNQRPVGDAGDNTIGGTTSGTRDIISGNARYGVLLTDITLNGVTYGNKNGATRFGWT